MQTIIVNQHAKQSLGQLVKLRASLEHMHKVFSGRLSLAIGCSGTDLIWLVVTHLFQHWKALFGITSELSFILSCEKATVPQRFIRAHWTPGALFADLA